MGHKSEKGVQTEKEVGDIQTQTLSVYESVLPAL